MKISKIMNNKGYSLLELVAVIAILAMIIVPIGNFLLSNYRTYHLASNQINSQQEAQKTMSLMVERAMGAKGMTISEADGLLSFNFDMGESGSTPLRWNFQYDSAQGILYGNSRTDTTDLVAYGNNIQSLTVSQISNKGVRFSMRSTTGGEQIDLSNEVYFRNR